MTWSFAYISPICLRFENRRFLNDRFSIKIKQPHFGTLVLNGQKRKEVEKEEENKLLKINSNQSKERVDEDVEYIRKELHDAIDTGEWKASMELMRELGNLGVEYTSSDLSCVILACIYNEILSNRNAVSMKNDQKVGEENHKRFETAIRLYEMMEAKKMIIKRDIQEAYLYSLYSLKEYDKFNQFIEENPKLLSNERKENTIKSAKSKTKMKANIYVSNDNDLETYMKQLLLDEIMFTTILLKVFGELKLSKKINWLLKEKESILEKQPQMYAQAIDMLCLSGDHAKAYSLLKKARKKKLENLIPKDTLNNVIASLIEGKSISVALSELQRDTTTLNDYGKGLLLLAFARDQTKKLSILDLTFIEKDLKKLPLWSLTAAMARLNQEIEDSEDSDDADLIYQNYTLSELLEKIFIVFMDRKQFYLLSEKTEEDGKVICGVVPNSIFVFDDESFTEEKMIVDVLFQREMDKMSSLNRLVFLLHNSMTLGKIRQDVFELILQKALPSNGLKLKAVNGSKDLTLELGNLDIEVIEHIKAMTKKLISSKAKGSESMAPSFSNYDGISISSTNTYKLPLKLLLDSFLAFAVTLQNSNGLKKPHMSNILHLYPYLIENLLQKTEILQFFATSQK